MCIIIDTNAFAAVFDASTSSHDEFAPVLRWIKDGKGKIVYGGTTYKNELRRATKYLRLMVQLKTAGKIIEICDEMVDRHEEDLAKQVPDPDFDDRHIAAIIKVSGCKLVCTQDARSHRFLKRSELYRPHRSRPKFYSGKANASLLSDRYITECCKPAHKVPGLNKLLT